MSTLSQPDLFCASPVPLAPLPDGAPPELARIIDYLRTYCRGPERSATSVQIAAAVGIAGRDPGRPVRMLLSIYRDHLPFVLVGKGGSGYYVTDDPDEMTHYDHSLYALLRAAALLLASHRRAASRQGFDRVGAGAAAIYRPRSVQPAPVASSRRSVSIASA